MYLMDDGAQKLKNDNNNCDAPNGIFFIQIMAS